MENARTIRFPLPLVLVLPLVDGFLARPQSLRMRMTPLIPPQPAVADDLGLRPVELLLMPAAPLLKPMTPLLPGKPWVPACSHVKPQKNMALNWVHRKPINFLR